MLNVGQFCIPADQTVLQTLRKLDDTGRRILFLTDAAGRLQGAVTDGDIRKFILRGGKLEQPIDGAANHHPFSLPVSERDQARELMRQKEIDALPLLDENGAVADIVFAAGKALGGSGCEGVPVVIMAGGLGTRLYPYTKILPKPLIPVGEVPIVEHIINRFRACGCSDFHLVVNYRKNMIKSYFSEIDKNYSVRYADEDVPLGTGGGLCLLKGKVNSTFFLSNCDILLEADFGDILRTHKEAGNVITMVCAVKHFTVPYGVIELDDTGAIQAMREKPEMNFLTNTGVYVAEPEVIADLEDGKKQGFTDIIDRYRAAGRRVGVYPISENSWMDMGQMEELDRMRRRLEES